VIVSVLESLRQHLATYTLSSVIAEVGRWFHPLVPLAFVMFEVDQQPLLGAAGMFRHHLTFVQHLHHAAAAPHFEAATLLVQGAPGLGKTHLCVGLGVKVSIEYGSNLST